MEKSKVYFTDMRCPVGTSLQKKLEKLIEKAGIGTMPLEEKFVAIKIHFGEPGNLSFLRPNFSKTVVDVLQKYKAKPFLTDCNTLYVGRRKDALEHITTAYENGYSPFSTGCHVIIGDGLKGTDDIEIPLEGTKYCKSARIGRAIMDADVFISLSHFKGHELTGFGGAIKNIGMGCGSRAGKMHMHCDGKPSVSPEKCRSCGVCSKYCAHGAISHDEQKKAYIDHDKCAGCGRCMGVCNFDAIEPKYDASPDTLNYRMVEYTKAVIQDRPHFHISIVNQVSPYCDCHGDNDVAVVPDLGMFASFDPVALDKACIDAVNAAPAMPGSIMHDSACSHEGCGCESGKKDHFKSVHPTTNWRTQISHAEEIGIGSGDYELITIK